MIIKKNLHIFLFLLLASTIFAENIFSFLGEKKYNLEFKTALISGTSYELVYEDDGRKLSELIWELNETKLCGFTFSTIVADKVKLKLDYMTNFDVSDGYMVDYDWRDKYDWLEDTNGEWTDFSKSPTDNENVTKIDAIVQVPAYSSKFFDLSILLGYKYDSFKWEAVGGYYIYPLYQDGGVRQDVGTFDDEPVITYTQHFRAPYLGLELKTSYKKLTINGSAKYSGLVSSNDEDIHHLRDLLFKVNFDDGKMYEYDISTVYNFNHFFSVFFSYDYLKYPLNKGQTTMKNLGSDSSYTEDNDEGAGISHNSETYALGFSLLFDGNLFKSKSENEEEKTVFSD